MGNDDLTPLEKYRMETVRIRDDYQARADAATRLRREFAVKVVESGRDQVMIGAKAFIAADLQCHLYADVVREAERHGSFLEALSTCVLCQRDNVVALVKELDCARLGDSYCHAHATTVLVATMQWLESAEGHLAYLRGRLSDADGIPRPGAAAAAPVPVLQPR